MSDSEISRLIQSSEGGNAAARKELFSVLYDELHRIAQRELRRNGSLTMSPTTLLHEAYLSMSAGASPEFPDRARFLAYACRAMRGLVIDYIRSRSAQKRGGEFEFTALPTAVPAGVNEDLELERLGEAVDALAALDPRLARVVDLKFFCGFSFEEVAGLMDISVRTAKRDWDKARMFLQRELRASDTGLPAFD
ncbi:MAG TPA: ECF-type sigma factor [Steroidobacteraceae bacterium]|jgi:RNA polymerase sigma factor (TIGR02999 family)|nr:ECF-type sigma factor [Steroidobacteraceae bacterium]